MQINELLKETMDAQASDLHLTVGRKPMLRVWGKLQPLEQHEVLTPEDTAQLAYRNRSSKRPGSSISRTVSRGWGGSASTCTASAARRGSRCGPSP